MHENLVTNVAVLSNVSFLCWHWAELFQTCQVRLFADVLCTRMISFLVVISSQCFFFMAPKMNLDVFDFVVFVSKDDALQQISFVLLPCSVWKWSCGFWKIAASRFCATLSVSDIWAVSSQICKQYSLFVWTNHVCFARRFSFQQLMP